MELQLINTDMTKLKERNIVAVMFQSDKGDLSKYSIGELKAVRKGDIEYVEKQTVDGEKYFEPKITEQMYKRMERGYSKPSARQMEAVMVTKKDLDKYVEDTERKIELMEMNLVVAYDFYRLLG